MGTIFPGGILGVWGFGGECLLHGYATAISNVLSSDLKYKIRYKERNGDLTVKIITGDIIIMVERGSVVKEFYKPEPLLIPVRKYSRVMSTIFAYK